MLDLREFLKKYFIDPIIFQKGFNPVNTLAYGLVFVISAYLIFKVLSRLRISVDKRLALAISPFVIFGSLLRVLVDSEIIQSYLLVTPMIGFVIFSLTFFLLLISILLQRKFGIAYFKTLFIAGILLLPLPLAFLKFKNFYGAFLVLTFFLPWLLIFRSVKWHLENKVVALVQTFDATTTFVAMNFFGYFEQHVIPTFFISFLTPISFVFLKVIATVVILTSIDKYSKEKNFNNYLKLIIGILGGATGARDFFRLLTLV